MNSNYSLLSCKKHTHPKTHTKTHTKKPKTKNDAFLIYTFNTHYCLMGHDPNMRLPWTLGGGFDPVDPQKAGHSGEGEACVQEGGQH